ncbi:spore germination protein, partial [Cytobacillus oceanisediminis]|uniref:spore germination protein n=1 Tax=Cytobacillus oceanisediminis TaxID=665099 RepID=UPI0011A894F9
MNLSLPHVKHPPTSNQLETPILTPHSFLFFHNHKHPYIYHTPAFPNTSLHHSPIQTYLSGPHVGFTETRPDNIPLIRH